MLASRGKASCGGMAKILSQTSRGGRSGISASSPSSVPRTLTKSAAWSRSTRSAGRDSGSPWVPSRGTRTNALPRINSVGGSFVAVSALTVSLTMSRRNRMLTRTRLRPSSLVEGCSSWGSVRSRLRRRNRHSMASVNSRIAAMMASVAHPLSSATSSTNGFHFCGCANRSC
jgi:hypothetical protein